MLPSRTLLLSLLLAAACNPKLDTAGVDADEDGYGEAQDCDDEDASINPGVEEEPYDGVDNDCDEATPDDDLDGDGYVESQDCDDEDPSSYPGGPEFCDGADNDCDGEVDDNALDTLVWYADEDNDGYGDPDNAEYACQEPWGYTTDQSDCDDTDAAIHPGAKELWDGVDNDCDGDIDEDGGAPEYDWFHDGDGDGYGDLLDGLVAHEQPYGYVANWQDCDDTDAEIHPGATERCNGLDDDCDTDTDEEGACLDQDVAGADDYWVGDNAGDAAGFSLDGGHDFSGDGTDDFIIGSPESTFGGQFYIQAGEYMGYATGLGLDHASYSGAVGWDPPESGNQLGYDVAWLPDVDGDGALDFGVGSPGAEGGAEDAGIVVLWMSSTESYYNVYISAENAALGMVTSAGDVDADGRGDVLVGAPETSNGDIGQGFALLYHGDSSNLIDTAAYWFGSDGGDNLGSQVGSAGDIDGDGRDDLMIGAVGYPSGAGTGAVWIVMGTGSWSGGEAALIDADHIFIGASTSDQAGSSMTGGQDFDADGYDDFVIGSPYNASNGSRAGAAYLWNGGPSWSGTGSWSLSASPTYFLGETPGERAGSSVDLLEDFDGSGVADLAIGSPYYSSGGSQRGRAYVIPGGPGRWIGACDLSAAEISWLGESSGDQLGQALSTAGDADADGLTDLLLAAPGNDDAGSSAGKVYLLLGW